MSTTQLRRARARLFPSESRAHSAAVVLVLLAATVAWAGFTGLFVQRIF